MAILDTLHLDTEAGRVLGVAALVLEEERRLMEPLLTGTEVIEDDACAASWFVCQ